MHKLMKNLRLPLFLAAALLMGAPLWIPSQASAQQATAYLRGQHDRANALLRQPAGDRRSAQLSEIVDAGALKPMLDEQQFNLIEVGQAYDRLTSGQAIGKVVVDV